MVSVVLASLKLNLRVSLTQLLVFRVKVFLVTMVIPQSDYGSQNSDLRAVLSSVHNSLQDNKYLAWKGSKGMPTFPLVFSMFLTLFLTTDFQLQYVEEVEQVNQISTQLSVLV